MELCAGDADLGAVDAPELPHVVTHGAGRRGGGGVGPGPEVVGKIT